MAQAKRTLLQRSIARSIAIRRRASARRAVTAPAAAIPGEPLPRDDEEEVVELRRPVTIHHVSGVDHTRPYVQTRVFSTVAEIVAGLGLDAADDIAERILLLDADEVYAAIEPFHEDRGRRLLMIRRDMDSLEESYLLSCDSI